MKVLVVLSCAVACVLAKPGVLAPVGLNAISYAGLNGIAAPGLAYSGIHGIAAPGIAYSGLAGIHGIAAPAYGYSSIAAPAYGYSPIAAPVAVSAAIRTQYHAQDELGQASYGHAEPFQTHNAVQDAAGNKIGSYSYVAPDGQVIRADYVADGAGFRVASNALPVGPSGTVGPVPVAVADTPEVVAARAAHLAEVEAAKSRTKRGIIAAGVPASTVPLAVAAPVAYAAHVAAPVAYAAHVASPVAYAAHVGAPVAYSTHVAHPLAYSTHIAAPLAAVAREATLTRVVNTPGHAVSYRVD